MTSAREDQCLPMGKFPLRSDRRTSQTIYFPIFRDSAVLLHATPLLMYNLHIDSRLIYT